MSKAMVCPPTRGLMTMMSRSDQMRSVDQYGYLWRQQVPVPDYLRETA